MQSDHCKAKEVGCLEDSSPQTVAFLRSIASMLPQESSRSTAKRAIRKKVQGALQGLLSRRCTASGVRHCELRSLRKSLLPHLTACLNPYARSSRHDLMDASAFSAARVWPRTVIVSHNCLDGRSATLLGDGTRAYHALSSPSSSSVRRAVASAFAVKLLPRPEMAISRVVLLSRYITIGRFRKMLFQCTSAVMTARNSSSKIIVFLDASPKTCLPCASTCNEKKARKHPRASNKAAPKPEHHSAPGS